MRWWFKKIVPSEKNGPITVRSLLGKTCVYAAGAQQSGPYLHGLWRTALQRVPNTVDVKKVLLIGLGAGSALYELERLYPHVQVTVVEWDPVMVQVAQEFGEYRVTPTILVGDAIEIVPNLTEQFDLILIDAFYGNRPDKRMSSELFVGALQKVLTKDGVLILNLSQAMSLLAAFRTALHLVTTWRYKQNTVAMFTGGHGGIRTLA